VSLSLTEFRANLYKIVDQAIKTGIPVELERRGVKIKLVPEKQTKKLDRLVKHKGVIKGDPDSFVHMDWSSEWDDKSL
jgi:prevent-host-death family protein